MIKTTLSQIVIEKYKNPYFFETGTAYADCVNLAVSNGFEKVFSVELNQSLQEKNKINLHDKIEEGKVVLITGDSLTVLKEYISQLDKRTTFWLDAHVDDGPCGIKKCPLYEELDAIATSPIKNHTILIDDMRILGSHWGEGISVETLKEKITSINPEYKFQFENGHEANDILAAWV
jgi:hypothetical protein